MKDFWGDEIKTVPKIGDSPGIIKVMERVKLKRKKLKVQFRKQKSLRTIGKYRDDFAEV